MLSYRERNRKTFQRNLLIGGGALGVGAALLSSSGNRAKLGNMFMSAARFLGSELEQARFGEVGQAFRQSMNSTMAEQNLRDSALGSALRTITRTGEGDALRMARREAAVAMAQHHGFNVADAQILFGEHGTTANIFNMGADKFLGHQFTQNHIFPQLSEEGARLARSKAGMGHLDQIIQNIQEAGVGVNLDLYRAHHSMAINSLEARFAKQGFADRVLSKFGVERHTLGQIVGDGFHEKVASSLGAGNYTLDPRGFMAFKEAVKPATDAERMYVEAAWSHHVAGRPVENLHSIGQLRTDVLSAANNTMINTGPFQNLVSSMGNFLDAHVQIPLMPGKQGLSIFKLKPWDNARARDFSGSIRRGTQLPTLRQGLEALGHDTNGLFDEQGRLQHDLMYSGDKLLHTGTNQVLPGEWTMMEDYRGFGQKYARVMTSANRNPRGAIRGMLGDTWLGKAFDIIGLDQQSTPSEVSKWYTSFARHLNPEAERYANNPITIFGRITSNPVPGPMDPNQTREIGTILSAVKAHTTLGDKGDIGRILTPELLQGAGVHQGLQDLIAGGLSGEDMATALRELDALTGSSSVVTSHRFFSDPNDRKSFETLRQVARRFAANEADVLSSTRRTGGANGPFNLEGLLGTTGNLSGEQNLREMFIDAALSQTISGTQDQRTSSMATILANAQKMGEDLHLSVGDVQDLRAGVWARYQHAALYSSEAERERSTQFIRSQLATNKVMQEDVGSVLDKTFGGFRPWTDVAETHTEGVGIYVAPKTEKSALFDWETPWNAAKAIIGQSPEAKANPSFSGWLDGISAVARSVITGTDGSMGWTQGPSEMLATGWRMNDLLGNWGLGLPDKDIQTVGDTAKNLVLKRILPAVGAVEAWKYLNYQTNAWTGTSPAKGMANIRAGASLTSASVFDALGITKLSKSFVDLTPGMENYIRPRDREEQEEYLKNGQDPVRSGRFWLTGSRSPIYGGKIKYFSPSWYQMQTSDWQGAENVDLNSQWYWKHKSLMPNLENPLAPLNIFDPYSWERCLLPDVLLLTQDGAIKRADEIEVGDILTTHTGKQEPVLAIWPKIVDESIYKITSAGSQIQPLKVTHDHKILAWRPHICKKISTDVCRPRASKRCVDCQQHQDSEPHPTWIPAEDLRLGDFLATPIPQETNSVVTLDLATTIKMPTLLDGGLIYLDRHGLHTRQNGILPTIKVDADLGKLIGYFLAEGCAYRRDIRFHLHVDEVEIAEDIAGLISKVFGGTSAIHTYGMHREVRWCNALSSSLFRQLFYDSCGEKVIPSLFYKTSPEFKLNLLLGLFLGDAHWRKEGIALSTTSIQMATMAKKFLEELGCIPSFRIHTLAHINDRGWSEKTEYVIHLYRPDIDRFFEADSKELPPRPSTIKRRQTLSSNGYIYRRIVKIETEPYNGVVYDFTVGEDHSFCVIGYCIHNSHSTGPRADRPYLISGGQASSDNLLGQFWNATAGRILKPQVVMYPEYMSSKTQYFGGDSVGAGGVGGVMVQGGSAQPTVGGYGRSGSLFGEGFDQGNGPIQPDKPEYNVTNPNTPIARFRQIHHLFEKQQGIYGFADDTLKDHLGFNEVSKSAMMASPDQAYGWEDRYWSRDLGGLGGSLAAFTRRFLPHRDRSQTQYDPVPNRFFGSSWIPGDEASLNFQRGDALSSIQGGAFRLPGEAYERIHHPKLYQTRASSLGGSVEDIANSMFQIGLPGEEDDTSWGYGKYVTETGEKIHERIQKALESRGLLLSKEQRIYDPVLQATGHYDAVIKMDGQQVVGEIKSMGAKKFDAATAPLDAHRAQLNFYLHNLGLQQGLLVYVDRDNPGRIKTFDMAYDPGLYSETKSKVFAARREVDRLIDTGQRSRYDMYDAVTRAEILLNTEPWADKTHVAVSDAQKQVDDEHDPDFQEKLRRRLQIAKRQASQQSELYQAHNYRFNQATQSHSYTVKDIVGPDTIRVEEGNQLIQLAGVSPSKQKIESWMRQHEELVQGGMSQMDAFFAASGVSPGKRIRVITGADTQPDESSAIRGAVFANGRNLAKTMISQGVAEEDIDDNSAAGVMARYSTGDRMYGRIAEKLTHIDTPLASKFLSVGSALEIYKRKQIYGTVAGDWTAPMKTFLGPTTEAIASRNPILAALTGAMVGSFFGKSREAKVAFATAGALAGALLSGKRGAQEVITGEKWIPTRVRHRREVEEYYDTLKYVKAKSLEAHYARLGHVNIDQLMDEKRGAIDQVNSRMEELRARKNELLFSGKTPQQTSVEIKHLNDEMRILRQRNKNVKLLEGNAALALYYHREAMKTLYGSKPGDPIQMALAGVPRPERELINGVILHGNKHEKAELYRLLSKREKSVLGVYLGKKRRDLPAKETLQEYFKHHQLPDASWLGWTPSVDLNNARAISAKEEHITPIEMGIYPRNMMDAEVAMEDIPVPVISAKSHDIQNSLTKILSGLGYTNIEVQLDVTASDRQSRSDIRMDLSHDRTGQMMRALSK